MSWGPEHWRCRINKVTLKGNLKAFPGVTAMHLPARMQPDPVLVNLAQDLQGLAESGECQGVAVSWLDQAGQTYSTWGGADRFPASWLIGSIIVTAVELAVNATKARDYKPFR